MGAIAVGTAWAAPYTPASLASELRRLEAAIASHPKARPVLPAAWNVEAAGRTYDISTEPLKGLLDRGAGTQRATAWLEMLAQQLEGFDTLTPGASGERVKLNRILARPEFRGAREAGAWERLRQLITTWIQELVAKIVRVMAQHTTTSQFLFWVVVAGCVGFLAFCLIRWWGRDDRIPRLPQPERAETPARSWEQWLAAAHRAAQQGDWRQAIHSAYWAAISRLQQTGALPEDVTRTPREYLRQLQVAAAPREPLAALTTSLERFWYASRAAGVADFRESLTHLETLGCKVA